MRPHITCHMLSTVDGRIAGEALRVVQPGTAYEEIGAKLGGHAWLCGRKTMKQHFAEEGSFHTDYDHGVRERSVFVAERADNYAVSVDTRGQLRWRSGDLDGDHLICILSQQVTEEYLTYLRSKAVSYIVTGEERVDLQDAVETLSEDFGISTLLIEGGGEMNAGMLSAGLIDELSLLLAPGVDGRKGVPTVFDGLAKEDWSAVPLHLRSVDQLDAGVLWIRYDVAQQHANAA